MLLSMWYNAMKHEIKIVILLYFQYFGAYAFLFLGLYMFAIGFHNIDLVHNYQKLALDVNPYLVYHNVSLGNIDEVNDKNIDGILRPLSEGYHTGIKNMLRSVVYIFLSGVMFAGTMVDIWRLRK